MTICLPDQTIQNVHNALTTTGTSVTDLMSKIPLSRSAINRALTILEQQQKAKRTKSRHPTTCFNYSRAQPIDLWRKVK